MTAEPVTDLGIERLVRLDERIDAHEGQALRDRWEFGQEMLAARDGAGRLPNGYLADLVERTGKSRTELKYRAQFAETYPNEDELANALASFTSWFEVTQKALAKTPSGPAAPPPVPEGKFSTIVADPPWRYENTATENAAELHYSTMSIEQLCELDVARDKAADHAHLYLWTTASHLPDAFAVMAAWGFTYKTYLVWVKPQMGMGNYFRVSTELVLFGVKGGMRTQHFSLMNWFQVKRGAHSAKPEVFTDLVMKASPPPYLELFARCRQGEQLPGLCRCTRCRLGWTTWGNES
jgi:N6-adenosine-specific RNA methylase IME4